MSHQPPPTSPCGGDQAKGPSLPSRPSLGPNANPIFEKWLLEWMEVAAADTKNTKMKFVFAKALTSLRRHPFPLSSGQACLTLEHFGPYLCNKINDRMIQEDMLPRASPNVAPRLQATTSKMPPPPPRTNETATTRKRKMSVTSKPPNLKKYSSTAKANFKPPPLPSSIPKPIIPGSRQAPSCSGGGGNGGGVRLESGSFEVVLYIDLHETTGRSVPQNFVDRLKANGVNVLVRRLTVGDFVWVCREVSRSHSPHLQSKDHLGFSSANELVLPYVIERKRTDDLAHSIRDGRFVSQNLRLLDSKLKAIYLIEKYGRSEESWWLGEGDLDRTICDVQIQHGFWVQQTSSLRQTCTYLTGMTKQLKKIYERKTVIGCQKEEWENLKGAGGDEEAYLMYFSQFNVRAKEKNWKAKDMFARHLMRFQGISVEEAYAIICKFPTLDHLLQAYLECKNEQEKVDLLACIKIGCSNRSIGANIGRKISRFFNSINLS